MSSEIRVSFGALEATQGNLATTRTDMQQQLTDLEASLRPLTAEWTGSASAEYQQRWTTIRAASTDLTELLAGIERSLATASARFAQIERDNAMRFGG